MGYENPTVSQLVYEKAGSSHVSHVQYAAANDARDMRLKAQDFCSMTTASRVTKSIFISASMYRRVTAFATRRCRHIPVRLAALRHANRKPQTKTTSPIYVLRPNETALSIIAT